jgi:hypothetical protein
VSNEERYLKNGTIEGDYRIRFIREHLYWLTKAIEEGSHCLGYHLWIPIDCWSWINAYRNRYGLISNNIHTQRKTLKKSGQYFTKRVLTSKAVSYLTTPQLRAHQIEGLERDWNGTLDGFSYGNFLLSVLFMIWKMNAGTIEVTHKIKNIIFSSFGFIGNKGGNHG